MDRSQRILVALSIAVSGVLQSTATIPGSLSPNTFEWSIRTWETEDGLPENSATAIAQDHHGYLWFGTFKGLVRFDGVRFTVFDRSNTPGLPSDGIVNLHLDQKGRLWISTLAGLVLRDSSGWHPMQQVEAGKRDFIRTFTERVNGDLLLTTFTGKVFEYANQRLVQLPGPPGQPGVGYLGSVDQEGLWWVAQLGFVGRWSGGRWQAIVSNEDLAAIKPTQIGIASSRDGSLWVLLNSELRKYAHGVAVFRRPLDGVPGNFWSMTEDSAGNIWICTQDQGVVQVPPSGDLVRWNEQNGVSYHSTRFVFEDRENSVWIGTTGGGLQRLKMRRFQTFGPGVGLAERAVKSVSSAADGSLWLATYGKGVFRWTEAGITNVSLAAWTNQNLYAQSVLSDSKGRTWIGTYAEGLFLLDANGCRRFLPQQLGGDNIIALFEDSTRRIWLSSSEGVCAVEHGEFRIYNRFRQGGSLVGVSAITEGSDGVVWVSSPEGVFRLKADEFEEVKDSDGKPVTGITCLHGDLDGSVWMGSSGAGLLRWKNGLFRNVGVGAGLVLPTVHGILYDGQGGVWLPSNRGVMRVERRQLESVADGRATRLSCQLLDRSDGLESVECPSSQQPVCARDRTGRLWFATLKGVATIDPRSFRLNLMPPSAIIEDLAFRTVARTTFTNTAANHRMSVSPDRTLELPAGCRGIEIYYTAPSFVSPEKVKFQISMDGNNLDWLEVGGRRVAYFDELEPGVHVFKVRAANDDGLWNQTPASLSLVVLPFFWQTRLFQGVVLTTMLMGGFLWVYRLKLKFEHKRVANEAFTQQLILRQETERKRVASELHDGLGQDLLLIKNRVKMLAADSIHSPKVAQGLCEISDYASHAIADVRAISHALRPTALEQVGLTKAIEWMIEQIASSSSTRFSAELENIDGLLAPEREINLYRIVQEGLNNVLKHAHASEVILQIRRERKAISVSLLDNGCGFPERPDDGTSRSGFGLTGMRERAKALGGSIELLSAPGRGTRVTLRVPLAGAAL